MAVKESAILAQLEELAQSLGMEIRNEPLKREGSFFPGGLCRVKGEYVLIFNTMATREDRIEALVKAVKRFDPALGVRLVSFAVHWIRAEIHEFILRNWRIVKVATTKAQRKLFFNLRSARKHLGWLNQEEVAEVAKDLGVQPETVWEMERRLSAHDASFDGSPDGPAEEGLATPAAYLEDLRFDPATQLEEADWKAHGAERLAGAFAGLDDRSRNILMQRWLKEDRATLNQLAAQHQVSAERIRQLERNAIRKLKDALLKENVPV